MNYKMYKQPGLFFTLSAALPWALWFFAAWVSHLPGDNLPVAGIASLIAFLGLTAPLGITYFMSRRNKELRKDLLSRFFNFKNIPLRYFLLAFLLMLVSILLAQAVSLLFGYSADQFRLAGHFSFTSGVFPVWFMLVAAPMIEELAWHSYGTDCLRSRYNLFTTSLLFGVYWGIWHFPLSFIKDYYHSNLMESGWIYSLNFILSLIPFVLIMNWLYYKANRNIILPVIFHITAGYFNEIFTTHPMSKVIQTGLLLVLSAYLVIKEKDFFFQKDPLISKRENRRRHFMQNVSFQKQESCFIRIKKSGSGFKKNEILP